MATDEPAPLTALFLETAQVLVAAQKLLDDPSLASEEEIRSGTRFRLNSIPELTASLRFGVVNSSVDKFLFIPVGRTESGLHHQVSFALRASPAPMQPALYVPGPSDPFPLILEEPSFLADGDEESELGWSLLAALGAGRWRARMTKAAKLTQEIVDRHLDGILKAVKEPDSQPPGQGLCAFRLPEQPPRFLIVYVTDDEDRDGVFVMNGVDSPIADIYTYPGDKNGDIHFEPLAALNGAVRAWLAGAPPRTRFLPSGLPPRWGVTSLEVLTRNLVAGYAKCAAFLAAQAGDPELPPLFELADIEADVKVSISYARGRSPRFSVADDSGGGELIGGRVQVRLPREGEAVLPRLSLISPGFVLAGEERAEFIARAQDAAEDIANAFLDLTAEEYEAFLRRPSDEKRITVFLSAKDEDAKFRFLVSWPGRDGEGNVRDFVFTCAEGDDGELESFKPVIQVTDDVQTASIPTVDGGTYEAYNRFFRAVRIWRAGTRI
jgi:hypothetical protein